MNSGSTSRITPVRLLCYKFNITLYNSFYLVSSSDCGAAEWLWGYNNTGNSSNTTNISTHAQPSVTSNQPGSYNLPQYSQPPQISPQQVNAYFVNYLHMYCLFEICMYILTYFSDNVFV